MPQKFTRRSFLKTGSAVVGAGLVPGAMVARPSSKPTGGNPSNKGVAKNVIFLVSDGMSSGTFALADYYSERVLGRPSYWKTLMARTDTVKTQYTTHSLSSVVTDSAAAASAWGCGQKVKNGSLNVLPDGTKVKPIMVKAKEAGKAIGVVTTVRATHATPAGFIANNESRNNEEEIAARYFEVKPDVIMGGGLPIFSAEKRKDGRDLIGEFASAGYDIATSKTELAATKGKNRLLGLFAPSHLPYALDRKNFPEHNEKVPGLVEMTKKALAILRQQKNGFVLQVEAGRVDHAAHANDAGGLLFDQLEFDEVIALVDEFVKEEPDTLVIISTDHGNSNPALIQHGSKGGVDSSLRRLADVRYTNNHIYWEIGDKRDSSEVAAIIEKSAGFSLTDEELAQLILGLDKKGTEAFRVRNHPIVYIGQIFSNHLSVGWSGTSHTPDFVPATVYGPGANRLSPIHDNIDLNKLMVEAMGL